MTQQTSGMPDLKYSEETFREMYEALKGCRFLRNPGISQFEWALVFERIDKILAKVRGSNLCEHCGTDIDVEREVFSQGWTGHSCRGQKT